MADPAALAPLAADRWQLTVGDPEQWLPASPDRPRLLATARQTLADALLDPEREFRLRRGRLPLLRREP